MAQRRTQWPPGYVSALWQAPRLARLSAGVESPGPVPLLQPLRPSPSDCWRKIPVPLTCGRPTCNGDSAISQLVLAPAISNIKNFALAQRRHGSCVLECSWSGLQAGRRQALSTCGLLPGPGSGPFCTWLRGIGGGVVETLSHRLPLTVTHTRSKLPHS